LLSPPAQNKKEKNKSNRYGCAFILSFLLCAYYSQREKNIVLVKASERATGGGTDKENGRE
jgi:hypothetical protein